MKDLDGAVGWEKTIEFRETFKAPPEVVAGLVATDARGNRVAIKVEVLHKGSERVDPDDVVSAKRFVVRVTFLNPQPTKVEYVDVNWMASGD